MRPRRAPAAARPSTRGQRVDADAAGAQQHWLAAGESDDRAFDADVARASVEDHRHRVAQVVRDMLRGGGRYVPEPVGRRRRDPVASEPGERGEQCLRDRMRRHAQPHAVLAAGDGVVDMSRARQDQRQRSWPESGGEATRAVGKFARPASTCATSCTCTITG